MQERKRAEAIGRQDHSTTAALSIAHTDAALPPADGHFCGLGDRSGTTSASLGESTEASPFASATASPTARSMYLARRTSIVDGLSAHELLMQHRRSLIGLVPVADPAAEVERPAIADLEGVTLSKRHTYTKTEYDAGANATKFQELQAFKVGFDEGDEQLAGDDSPSA